MTYVSDSAHSASVRVVSDMELGIYYIDQTLGNARAGRDISKGHDFCILQDLKVDEAS